MADLEGVKIAKNYHTDVPFANNNGFYVKGANHLPRQRQHRDVCL